LVRADRGRPGRPDRGALENPRGHRKKLTALLDAQAGVQFEGEDVPQASDGDLLAVAAWNALHNGQGAIDWAGLPVVASWLGVEDIDGLLHRMLVIKGHRPDKE
jgi:hypothetical protein